MIYLSEADTHRLLTIDDALEMIRQVAVWESEGAVSSCSPTQVVLQMDQPKCRYRAKSAALNAIPVAGIRIIGYPSGKEGAGGTTRFVLLSDPATGKPLALIDDHWSYTLRTAASAVVGLRYLLPVRKLTVGLVGAGNLARATILILKHLDLLERVKVTSRRAESRARFAEQFGGLVTVTDSVRDAVQDVDLVVTATNANKQLVESQWIAAGTTLCTLGQHELDPELYRRAGRIVVDSWEVSSKVGDVKQLLAGGSLTPERIDAELHDLVTGKKPGRASESELIIYRTDGLVSQDVGIAYAVYRSAVAAGMGIQLEGVPVA